MLKTIAVKSGGKTFDLALLSDEEAKAHEVVGSLVAQAQDGRWLAFKTTEPLPADAQVNVTVGPGVPSAEGPLKSAAAESFSFRTYGPLRITRSECGWGGECMPFSPWQIEFSNPLDRNTITDDAITIDPPLASKSIDVYGNTLQIRGESAGRTTYRVTVGASIGDVFGQTLGQKQTVTFAVGSAQPAMQIPGGNFVVLDPLGKPGLSAYTINYSKLGVRAYAVTPEDWPAFRTYLRERYRTDAPPPIPGKLVYQKTVNVEAQADRLAETFIDLEAAYRQALTLPQAQGHLVVLVKPELSGLAAILPGRNQPEEAAIWTQKTQVGLDAFVDAGQMLAWANDLKTGAPLGEFGIVAVARRAEGPHVGRRRGDDPAARRQTRADASGAGRRRGRDAPRRRVFLGRRRLEPAPLDRHAAVVCLRRPPDVQAGRGSPRQRMGAPDGCRPAGRHRPACRARRKR